MTVGRITSAIPPDTRVYVDDDGLVQGELQLAEREGQMLFYQVPGGGGQIIMYVVVNTGGALGPADGGNFETGTSTGNNTVADGGNFETGASTGNDNIVDGGNFETGISTGVFGKLSWAPVVPNTVPIDLRSGKPKDPLYNFYGLHAS